jgi:hypothetical protein
VTETAAKAFGDGYLACRMSGQSGPAWDYRMKGNDQSTPFKEIDCQEYKPLKLLRLSLAILSLLLRVNDPPGTGYLVPRSVRWYSEVCALIQGWNPPRFSTSDALEFIVVLLP